MVFLFFSHPRFPSLSHDLTPCFTSSPSPTLLSLRLLLSSFLFVFCFVLSRHRTPLFLYLSPYLSPYLSFFRHFLFFLFPDRAEQYSLVIFSIPSSVLLFLQSILFLLKSLLLYRAPSFFRSIFIALFLSKSHFLSPSQHFFSHFLSRHLSRVCFPSLFLFLYHSSILQFIYLTLS